ncbi:MAG: EF-P lysine aminoacylase GenX [Fibrobacteria bacterium]|nr:EF-P lysine aminoacylase GenX [Fibrobacteria bacterium]
MSLAAAKYRAQQYARIREHFFNQDVLEVETPLLSRGVAVDCHIDLFSTRYIADGMRPEDGKLFYLQSSPELFMKRMLSQGFPSIYQITKAFRQGETGKHHNPEFTLLEWYRLGFDFRSLIDDVRRVCQLVLGELRVSIQSYQTLFIQHTGIDPLTASQDDLQAYLDSQGKSYVPFNRKDDLLNFIFSDTIEACLPPDTLVFVYHYPREMPGLALLDKNDPRIAKRFEAYYNGVELCNGYEELTNSTEYKERFTHENEKRREIHKPPLPLDKAFLSALTQPLPSCSGVALGLDRLLMLGLKHDSLNEVIHFPSTKH